jgi:hypothetical protein
MRLIPREEKFFDLFEEQAANLLKGAQILLRCFEQYTSLDAAYVASKEIREIEHTGDSLVHDIVARLNKSFVTPLDREDIYELTCRLDDVLDYVDAVAERLIIFQIQKPTPYATELSRIIVRASEEISQAMRLLRNLRDVETISRQCAKINQLENDADQVLREAFTNLFQGNGLDPISVIKWKDIYEHLETASDKCEDVANVIDTVIVKYT